MSQADDRAAKMTDKLAQMKDFVPGRICQILREEGKRPAPGEIRFNRERAINQPTHAVIIM